MDRLDTQLARLVEQQILSASQAQELLAAARADGLDRPSVPMESAPRSNPKGSAVLEVLGYVGGALVLGAVIMLGSLFWDDLGSTGRKMVAVALLGRARTWRCGFDQGSSSAAALPNPACTGLLRGWIRPSGRRLVAGLPHWLDREHCSGDARRMAIADRRNRRPHCSAHCPWLTH